MSFFKKFENHLVAPKADVNLTITDSCAVLGDTVDGTFTVTPHEDIVAEEIRCEIRCDEAVQVNRTEYDPVCKCMVNRQVTENRVLYQAKPSCGQPATLANGVTKTYQVSVPLPPAGRPTFVSAYDNVRWLIKGVVAVHGRPDVTTKEVPLQVIPQSERPANQPAKVRLVNCQYCQAAMPEDVLVCPNCGAHRTAP